MKKRSFGLDLVRAVALLFVVLVHSFMHSGFNGASLNSLGGFFLLSIRCIAFVGVLLFMILTGYLKSKKKVDKNHYKSIINVLVVYFIISIISILFKKCILHEDRSLVSLVIGIFNYTSAPYSWYVKMYIGLFLLIPFLNILYNGIDTKRNKQFLILTLFVLTSLFPTISRLVVSNYSLNIAPDWWGQMYPLLLYFVGCYIKEYEININKFLNFSLILLFVYLQTVLFYFYAQSKSVNDILICENSIFAVILAILIFLFLYNIKTYSKFLSSIVGFISKASFGGYLISYCFDMIFYRLIPIFDSSSSHYFYKCSFILTLIIFTCSVISSAFINLIIKIVGKFINYIKRNRQLKISEIEPF